MEQFVFASNRRRWRYLRPVLGATMLAAGMWLAALCWVLLEAPPLPDLDLRIARSIAPASEKMRLARGPGHGTRLPVR